MYIILWFFYHPASIVTLTLKDVLHIKGSQRGISGVFLCVQNDQIHWTQIMKVHENIKKNNLAHELTRVRSQHSKLIASPLVRIPVCS